MTQMDLVKIYTIITQMRLVKILYSVALRSCQPHISIEISYDIRNYFPFMQLDL